MNRRFVLVLALAGLFVGAQALFAQDKGEKKKNRGPGGRVKSVDATAKTMVVTTGRKGETQDKTFKLAKDVKVTINGEAKALSDVAVGMIVRLTVGKDDEVTEIAVVPPRKKKNKQ